MTVQEMIDKKLAQEQELRKDRVTSGKFKPSLFGACYRRQWYAKTQEPETNPTDARGLRVFQAGKLFHDFVQQFYTNEQKEVLIETDKVKGYADLVSSDEVADIKSIHSDGFFYLNRNVVCTLESGKVVRFAERDIQTHEGCEQVFYYKKWQKVISKKTLTILEDKINNWLQVCWYAVELGKEKCRLVFISKDDLCINEYVIATEKIKPILDSELNLLYDISSLPDGKPRLYNGGECEWCSWKDKCEKDNACKVN